MFRPAKHGSTGSYTFKIEMIQSEVLSAYLVYFTILYIAKSFQLVAISLDVLHMLVRIALSPVPHGLHCFASRGRLLASSVANKGSIIQYSRVQAPYMQTQYRTVQSSPVPSSAVYLVQYSEYIRGELLNAHCRVLKTPEID